MDPIRIYDEPFSSEVPELRGDAIKRRANFKVLPSLKLTAKTTENGWLEYFLVSFWGPAYFQGRKTLVSGRVGTRFMECILDLFV